jgi:hypothetical protein
VLGALLAPVASAQVSPGVQPLEPTGPAVTTVTPTFRWTPADPDPAARPIVYRLRIARSANLAPLVVDTALTDAERYDLGVPLKPGPGLYWRVDATTILGATSSTGTVGPHSVPPWATLTTLNDPQGSATDDPQPLFTWTAPAITAPPGPFRFDLFVARTTPGYPATAVLGIMATSQRAPAPLETNVTYSWSLVVHAGSDTSLVRSVGAFIVLDSTLPRTTLLYQNFPNPFPTPERDQTCIWFDLAAASSVELDILDLRGSTVRRLLPSTEFPEVMPPDRYGRGDAGGNVCDPRLTWDGTATNGRTVPPGVYLVRLKASGAAAFRRMVFRGRGR